MISIDVLDWKDCYGDYDAESDLDRFNALWLMNNIGSGRVLSPFHESTGTFNKKLDPRRLSRSVPTNGKQVLALLLLKSTSGQGLYRERRTVLPIQEINLTE